MANYTEKFYNEDCMKILTKLNDNHVNLTLTDIPYDEVNRTSGGLRNLDRGKADVLIFPLKKFIDEVVRVTSGSIYIFCGSGQVSFIRQTLIEHKLSVRHCIWEKTNPSPMNGQNLWLSSMENCVFAKKPGSFFSQHEDERSCVWKHPIEHYKNHPTPKPVLLMEKLILASSQGGDTVLDPCMGSGAVGVAAKMSGRNFIGVELEEKYFLDAEKRINNIQSPIFPKVSVRKKKEYKITKKQIDDTPATLWD